MAPQTVSSPATLTFEISLIKQVPAGGQLVLDFGSFELAAPVNSVVSCSATYGFAGNASCLVSSKSKIVIKGAFPTLDNLLIFSLNSVTTPSYVNDFPVVVSSLDSASALIE